MLPPEKEKRLAQIDPQIKAVEKTLGETPTQLTEDFEKWLADLEKPIDWQDPKIVSHSGRDQEVAKKPAPPAKPSKISGRFVRIEAAKGHSGFITISEVEIYSAGKNIARAGTAKQSSDYNGASRAAKAIDGTNDGSFASCACTREQVDPWWEIDLGADQAIDHILIYNRNDCCPERLDHVLVDILDARRAPVKQSKVGDSRFGIRRIETVLPELDDKAL